MIVHSFWLRFFSVFHLISVRSHFCDSMPNLIEFEHAGAGVFFSTSLGVFLHYIKTDSIKLNCTNIFSFSLFDAFYGQNGFRFGLYSISYTWKSNEMILFQPAHQNWNFNLNARLTKSISFSVSFMTMDMECLEFDQFPSQNFECNFHFN